MNHSRKNSLIIRLFLLGVFFVSTAHAQVVPTNLWNPNYGSSTITPRPSTLQVPCANIVGGCASGGSTTTINGVTGPTFTVSIVATTSASSVTTSTAQILLNLLSLASSSDITISPTGTIIFASHNISQFTNNAGYGTSNVSTSTANTWSQTQMFNGISNTGNVTSTSYQASSTIQSNIAHLGNTFNIPANYATAGCPWGGTFDLGGCVMDAYESESSTQSSTPTINIPILPPFTTFSTPINFGNANEYADLECAPGQILEYTGATTATSGAVTYNEGDASAANLKIAHLGGSNCHIALGSSAPAAGATSTAVYIGGTHGESGLVLNNMAGIYAGIAITDGANAFMVTTNNFVADGDNQANVVATGSNSGETLVNNAFHALDIANATTSTLPVCIQTGLNAFTELDYINGSNLDDCGGTIGPTTGSFHFAGNLENPAATANTSYPKYPFFTFQSSTVLTASITGGINLDANSVTSSPTSVVVDDAVLTINNVSVGRNGNQTATNLIDISGNPAAQFSGTGNSFAPSAVTNFGSSTAQLIPTSTGYTFASNGSGTTAFYGYSANCGASGANFLTFRDQFGDEFQVGNCANLQTASAGIGGATGANGNVAGAIIGSANAGSDSINAVTNVYIGSASVTSTRDLTVASSIFSGVSGTTPLCIEGPEAGATSTIAYISVNSSAALTVTTTKPAYCQ